MGGGSATTIRRGALIVLEGCDRTGKTTQSRLLAEFLTRKEVPVKHMVFPARQSNIGQVINAYLTNKNELSDEVIHMLFTANRWEFKNEMKKQLETGTTLIVDRYSYSGVAYSVAKGLDFDWCMAPERGLIRPDAVFYLNAKIDKLLDRGNYGDERYEKFEFQNKVQQVFDTIYRREQSYWHEFDASQTQDNISAQLSAKALEILEGVQQQEQPLQTLQ